MSDNIAQDNEELSFGLIAASGAARSLSFEALKEARNGNFDKADELMRQSQETFVSAHDTQTQLLTREAQGNHIQLDVILVHAQDHLMTSMLAQELIVELINLYRTKQDKQ
ncbi:PTS system cellobiose-specific IIA component [Olsenella profusa DSM 13989]|uniref:PTS lactose/cellobiose transporter subunit IIA n=1 Tax=Olsenella profusa TaxID=138595 RepID=UPI002781BB33|nr:PTS lactose/cellobiose transporter subunit IIA [Olsenella profusa]MDP9858451.1 PTS system cellobiose-specific IIA component [Olsenella profusa DSM 13989]